MKKLFTLMLLMSALVLLSACGNNYKGPIFLGLEMSSEIPNDSYKPEFLETPTKQYMMSVKKSTTKVEQNNYKGLSISSNNTEPGIDADFVTTVGNHEYITIYLSQPENDYYSIVTVFINNKPYQIGAVTSADPDGPKVTLSNDGTKVYIPFEMTEDMVGLNTLEVTRIVFVDGESLRSVLKGDNSFSSIVVGVKNNIMSAVRFTNSVSFNLDERYLEIYEDIANNTSSIEISKIYINDLQSFELDTPIHIVNGTRILIPATIEIPNDTIFLKVGFEYNVILNIKDIYQQIALNSNSEFVDFRNFTIPIRTEAELHQLKELLETIKNTSYKHFSLSLVNDLNLVEQFPQFNTDSIHIDGNGKTLSLVDGTIEFNYEGVSLFDVIMTDVIFNNPYETVRTMSVSLINMPNYMDLIHSLFERYHLSVGILDEEKHVVDIIYSVSKP